MHARLFLGFVLRLPMLIARKLSRTNSPKADPGIDQL